MEVIITECLKDLTYTEKANVTVTATDSQDRLTNTRHYKDSHQLCTGVKKLWCVRLHKLVLFQQLQIKGHMFLEFVFWRHCDEDGKLRTRSTGKRERACTLVCIPKGKQLNNFLEFLFQQHCDEDGKL